MSLQLAVLYRIIHSLNAGYALAVFWLYVGAFILGLSMIFVFPQIGVVLVFLGLLVLGPVIIGGRVLAALDRAMTRTRLAQGVCPSCGQRALEASSIENRWHCANCLATYQATGQLEQSSVETTPP